MTLLIAKTCSPLRFDPNAFYMMRYCLTGFDTARFRGEIILIENQFSILLYLELKCWEEGLKADEAFRVMKKSVLDKNVHNFVMAYEKSNPAYKSFSPIM